MFTNQYSTIDVDNHLLNKNKHSAARCEWTWAGLAIKCYNTVEQTRRPILVGDSAHSPGHRAM